MLWWVHLMRAALALARCCWSLRPDGGDQRLLVEDATGIHGDTRSSEGHAGPSPSRAGPDREAPRAHQGTEALRSSLNLDEVLPRRGSERFAASGAFATHR